MSGKPQQKSKIRAILSRTKSVLKWPFGLLQKCSVRPFSLLQGGPVPATARLNRLRSLSPETVLTGYIEGTFPTGEPDGSIEWHCPPERAVIETGQVHVSKRLKSYLNKSQLNISFNRDFASVIAACADRDTTWIVDEIIRVYENLHSLGFAHSVEAWQDDELVGGGYGIALGKVFFLESMFCRKDHASKIAFVHLSRKLESDGFYAIDCQFLTEHWKRFGALPMSRDRLQSIVTLSLNSPASFQTENSLNHVDSRTPNSMGSIEDKAMRNSLQNSAPH